MIDQLPAMWFLFQGLIVFAVAASNIHWHWTPNNYVVAVFGFLAALLATVAVNNLLLWVGKLRGDAGTKRRIRPPPLPKDPRPPPLPRDLRLPPLPRSHR